MAWIWRVFGLVVLCCSSVAQATSLRYLNLQQLVDASEMVVRGRPVHQEAFWRDGRIVTRVRVAVDEVWVGRVPASREVEVLTLGGVVGDIGQRVDGAAVLMPGQDVVLQLMRGRDHRLWPVALAQGVWRIVPEAKQPQGPVRIVRPSADRLVVTPGTDVTPMPQTLDALKVAILEAAHGR